MRLQVTDVELGAGKRPPTVLIDEAAMMIPVRMDQEDCFNVARAHSGIRRSHLPDWTSDVACQRNYGAEDNVARITFDWNKTREIPLIEEGWKNIQLFAGLDPRQLDATDCVYVIRLAPPFTIAYGDPEDQFSPIIYIGSGAIRTRWQQHRKWLSVLGHMLPGARYEVWFCRQPRYEEVEANLIALFRDYHRRLPLVNLKAGRLCDMLDYDEKELQHIDSVDRRYWWALSPTHKEVRKYFERGTAVQEDDN